MKPFLRARVLVIVSSDSCKAHTRHPQLISEEVLERTALKAYCACVHLESALLTLLGQSRSDTLPCIPPLLCRPGGLSLGAPPLFLLQWGTAWTL